MTEKDWKQGITMMECVGLWRKVKKKMGEDKEVYESDLGEIICDFVNKKLNLAEEHFNARYEKHEEIIARKIAEIARLKALNADLHEQNFKLKQSLKRKPMRDDP